MNAERWLPVVGWEGFYEVSNLGRIRSIARVTMRNDGRRRPVPARVMKINLTGGDHPTIQLHRGGRKYSYLVHRLTLEAFVGPCPQGMEGCHNNGDPWDGRVSNLRWDTHASNMHDKLLHGTEPNAAKTHCARGHEFNSENTRYGRAARGGSGTWRSCRVCAYENRRTPEGREKRAAEYLRAKARRQAVALAVEVS